MAVTISNVYVQTFENIVRHLAQQSESRLLPTVDTRNVQSEKHNWETMGENVTTQKTAPRTATPENDSPWDRRVSVAATWHTGDSFEREDPVQMLVDPGSNIAYSLGMAMKRRQDDIIIAAATGNALDGAGAPVAFPAAQLIDRSTEKFSFDAVTEVYEKFMDNDIDPGLEKVFVIGPKQLRKLQQMTEYTSSDYVQVKALAQNGFVRDWMGFMWIVSTRLLDPAITAAGEIGLLAYSRKAIGLQMNQDIAVRVGEDPSISFAWRIYAHMTLGAVRVEDEHIVHLVVRDEI